VPDTARRPYPSDLDAREADGHASEPTAAIVDRQTARGTGVGDLARGHDPARPTVGRKRHLLVDATTRATGELRSADRLVARISPGIPPLAGPRPCSGFHAAHRTVGVERGRRSPRQAAAAVLGP
jgi:hypothetical protein